jgi:hypothetical protein
MLKHVTNQDFSAIFGPKNFLYIYTEDNKRGVCDFMALGISSFDSVNNAGVMPTDCGNSGQEVASNFGSIFSGFGFGGLFSGPTSKTGEGSGTVACLFGDNLSLDDGNGAGGAVLFGGFSGGGGSCGGGSVSLA